MPNYKTLIQDADDLDNVYPENRNDPKKTKVSTRGSLYHSRLNMAHGQLYKNVSQPGNYNFAIADIVFIIQTSKKRVAISFPIETPDYLFNYQNLPNADNFKSFCQNAQNNSVNLLSGKNLKLTSQGGYMDYYTAKPHYYPQKAYHSEKFFFHYLNSQGLKKIIDLFPTKSITSETLVSIDAMEVRMHSTRDMCPTCESISISEKESLKTKLNALLTNNTQYPPLPANFKCEFLISYNNEKDRKGKLKENLVGVKSQYISTPQDPERERKSLLHTHLYTCFTSGGSSPAKKAVNERGSHLNAAAQTKSVAKEITHTLTTEAAIRIQSLFRGFGVRKKLKNQAVENALSTRRNKV